jgi:hypothetical protein
MATIFCTSCGGKHDYSGFAPNFCSKCGTQIGGVKQQKAEAPKRVAPKTQEIDLEESGEDNTDIDYVPELDKLDVEIEIEGGFRVFNLEELSKTPANAKTKKFTPIRHGGIGDLSPQKYGSSKNDSQD